MADIEQAHFARDQRSLMAGANDEGKWRASTCRTRFCSARPASGLTKPFQSLRKRTFDQAIPIMGRHHWKNEEIYGVVPDDPKREHDGLIMDSGSGGPHRGLEIAVAAGDTGHNRLSDFVEVSAVLSQKS